MTLANQAFTSCWSHETFNHECHACLIHTVGKLCDILDGLLNEKKTAEEPKFIQGEVGYTIHSYELGSYSIESLVELTRVELDNIVLEYEANGSPLANTHGRYRIRKITDPTWKESLHD